MRRHNRAWPALPTESTPVTAGLPDLAHAFTGKIAAETLRPGIASDEVIGLGVVKVRQNRFILAVTTAGDLPVAVVQIPVARRARAMVSR